MLAIYPDWINKCGYMQNKILKKLPLPISTLFDCRLLLIISATSFAPQFLYAFSIYTAGHGDIGVGYSTVDGLDPHWHIGNGATVDGNPLAVGAEFEADALIARTSATRLSPIGSAALLGIPDSTLIYVAGSSTYQPNLGISAEELNPGDWTGDITLSLTGWDIPVGAAFALYSTNLADTTITDSIFSTFDGTATVLGNELPLTPGDHAHFQWAFTHLGDYELTFQWSGTHAVDGFQSVTESFTLSVVPEHSSYAVWIMLISGAFVLRRRRQRGI
jgi:surface-anchored protein